MNQRPVDVTAAQIEAWRAKVIASLLEDPEVPETDRQDPQLIEICIAGWWLFEQLERLGLGPEERKALSAAHGQMCVARRDPWLVAAVVIARWKAGRAPVPGPELAEELLTGDVSDLPPGGLRLQRRHGKACLVIE
jgi:hypothetical protein